MVVPEEEIGMLVSFMRDLPDPRPAGGNAQHALLDIVCIAVCAVISGADSFTGMQEYGVAKEAWFRQFLKLENGIPSHDTFRRVFAILDKNAWQACFIDWVRSLDLPAEEDAPVEVISIDGKTSRRSYGPSGSPLHTVSVWSHDHGIVLGSAQVPEKGNEITVIPELLATLDTAGATITIDAMGAQKHIAWSIREAHADYLLALKANHPGLHDDVRWLFEQHEGEAHWVTSSKGHGRLETREWWLLSNLEFLSSEQISDWRDLKGVLRVRSTRTIKDETSVQDRYYLTSLTSVEQAAFASRAHWGIENELHWTLDVAFRDDESRVWAGNAQANLVTLRHLALSLLKRETTSKASIKGKRQRAGWDTNYLRKVLNA